MTFSLPRPISRSEIKAILSSNSEGDLRRIGLHPNDFCQKWIPILYGVQLGEDLYRKACIQEFQRWLSPMGLSDQSIRCNWSWDGKQRKDKYPGYLPVVLGLVDRQYSILEKLGHLPRYQVERER